MAFPPVGLWGELRSRPAKKGPKGVPGLEHGAWLDVDGRNVHHMRDRRQVISDDRRLRDGERRRAIGD